MKKLLSCILAILVLAAAAMPAFAEGSRVAELKLEQYYADMPDIDVWFYPVDSDGNCIDDFSFGTGDIEAFLGSDRLQVVSAQRGSERPLVYVVLLDISKSTGTQFFKNFRQALSERAAALGSEDKLILITMGETVEVLLDGSESHAEASAAIAAIEQQGTNQNTQYYEALNKAIDKAERLADGTRCVLITISDGLNSASSLYTSEGTLERMKNAKLPMYTIGVGRSDNMAELQELASFTEKTNGAYVGLSSTDKNDPAKTEEALDSVMQTIASCFVVSLRASSNSVTGDRLRLKINSSNGTGNLNIQNFRIDSFQTDTTAPEVESVEITNPYTLTVKFTEAVLGADSPANYVLTDSDGVAAAVESASYDKGTRTASVKLQQPLYDGEYYLKCINITDDSLQKNPLKDLNADEPTVIQEGNPAPTPEPEPVPERPQTWFQRYGLFLFLGLVMLGLLIAILIVISTIKKRRAERENEYEGGEGAGYGYGYGEGETVYGVTPGSSVNTSKVNLSAVNGKNVDMTVVEKNGVSRDVSMFISDSCIVGRSAAVCDLTIEDQRISRQHCVLCYQGGEILINDLQSANGTTVNGIRVTDYRRLMPNDNIIIGNTKIIIKSC